MAVPEAITEESVVIDRNTNKLVILQTGQKPTEMWAQYFLLNGLILPEDRYSLSLYGLDPSMSALEKLEKLGEGVVPAGWKKARAPGASSPS